MASASSEGSITNFVSNIVSDNLAENPKIPSNELPIDSSEPTMMITEPPEASSVQMETDSIPDKSADNTEEAVKEDNPTKVIEEITSMETDDGNKTSEETKIEQDVQDIPVDEMTTPVLTAEILAPLSPQKTAFEQPVENKRKRSTSR